MTLQDISYLRLINQQIAGSEFNTPKEIVGWMGAIQAQDFAMAKWAVGMRLPGSTEKTINSAIDSGEIIRTHLLRPTWHFVSADDIYSMLSLTAPNIKAAMKSRDKQLELNDAVYRKSNSILEKALAGGYHLTRKEIADLLATEDINTSDNRLSHILMRAELDGIVCNGKTRNNKLTYALLSERAPKASVFSREESLGVLARTYFRSHGPATLKDFTWWSGLPVKDSKYALELVKHEFVSETVNNQMYWFAETTVNPMVKKDHIFMMPAYDEILISYKDRTAILPFTNHQNAVSNNGIFRPVIIVNNQVEGIWKRTTKNNKTILETNFFRQPDNLSREMIAGAFASYRKFINKEVEIL